MAFSGPVSAGALVTDIGNILQSFISAVQNVSMQGNDAAEYAKQAQRWQVQYDQYMQQLVNVQAQLRTVGLPEMQALVPIEETYMVKETCGGNGHGFQQIWAMVDMQNDASVRSQQLQICVNIRMMKNKKYNDSVDYLTHSIPGMKKVLADIHAVRASSNDQGTVQGADSESLRAANQLETSGLEWQGRMMAYDAYIETMQENQRILASEALKGSRSKRLVRSVVQSAALKRALDN